MGGGQSTRPSRTAPQTTSLSSPPPFLQAVSDPVTATPSLPAPVLPPPTLRPLGPSVLQSGASLPPVGAGPPAVQWALPPEVASTPPVPPVPRARDIGRNVSTGPAGFMDSGGKTYAAKLVAAAAAAAAVGNGSRASASVDTSSAAHTAPGVAAALRPHPARSLTPNN